MNQLKELRVKVEKTKRYAHDVAMSISTEDKDRYYWIGVHSHADEVISAIDQMLGGEKNE